MAGTQRGRLDKKRWRRRERKETSVLCSELAKAEMSNMVRTYSSIISDKHLTNFKANTLKNLNQIFCSLQWARRSSNEQPRHLFKTISRQIIQIFQTNIKQIYRNIFWYFKRYGGSLQWARQSRNEQHLQHTIFRKIIWYFQTNISQF